MDGWIDGWFYHLWQLQTQTKNPIFHVQLGTKMLQNHYPNRIWTKPSSGPRHFGGVMYFRIRFSLGRLSIGVSVRVTFFGLFRVRVRFWLGPSTQLDPRIPIYIMYNVHPMHMNIIGSLLMLTQFVPFQRPRWTKQRILLAPMFSILSSSWT